MCIVRVYLVYQLKIHIVRNVFFFCATNVHERVSDVRQTTYKTCYVSHVQHDRSVRTIITRGAGFLELISIYLKNFVCDHLVVFLKQILIGPHLSPLTFSVRLRRLLPKWKYVTSKYRIPTRVTNIYKRRWSTE